MGCHCLKCGLDLLMESYSRTTVIVNDISEWVVSERHTIPENFELLVSAPGVDRKKITFFTHPRVTKITTKELFDSETLSQLPGGIWKFETLENGAGCDKVYTIHRLNDFRIRCCIQKMIGKEDKSTINELIHDLDAIHSLVKFNQFVKAKDELEILNDKIEALNCSECKKC